jgi:multidrug efflux pump subunit AcrA (membrane-fusion protein)
LFFSAVSCHKGENSAKQIKEISVIFPSREDISKTVMVTGSIEAEGFAEIYPKGPGKVKKRILNEGDPVKKNQAILIIQNDDVGFTYKPAPARSVIDGFIGRILVDIGEAVTPQMAVATVVKPDKMRIRVDLPENYLPDVKLGTKVDFTVSTLPDDKFNAEVTSISQAIDLKTRTARVEFLIPNQDQKLVHGMFARLLLPIETHKNAMVLPNSAISWEADKQFVYKILDNKIARTEIKIGLRNESKIEIISGIDEGDRVADSNLLELKDGEEVKVLEK